MVPSVQAPPSVSPTPPLSPAELPGGLELELQAAIPSEVRAVAPRIHIFMVLRSLRERAHARATCRDPPRTSLGAMEIRYGRRDPWFRRSRKSDPNFEMSSRAASASPIASASMMIALVTGVLLAIDSPATRADPRGPLGPAVDTRSAD